MKKALLLVVMALLTESTSGIFVGKNATIDANFQKNVLAKEKTAEQIAKEQAQKAIEKAAREAEVHRQIQEAADLVRIN